MSQLNTSLPSVRRIHDLIRNKSEVEVQLTTGTQIKGKVSWIDDHCLCLTVPDGAKVVIWQHAIAYLR